MTSAKFSGFWTPSLPLSVPNSRNLPSFGQNLANPLPPPQSKRHMYMPPKLISYGTNFKRFAMYLPYYWKPVQLFEVEESLDNLFSISPSHILLLLKWIPDEDKVF